MINISELDFPGYKAQTTLGTFYQHETPSSKLAVIFPGYGYSCDRALLHFPLQMFLAQGTDVLQVNYSFTNKPGFWQSGEQTRALWFGSDAVAAMRTVLKKGEYTEITLLGKSIGTLAVGHISAIMPDLQNLRGMMLTPLLKNPGLVQQIIGFRGKILLAVGTADDLHDPAVLQEIRAAREVEIVEVEGADHSLEKNGDVGGSLDALRQVMLAIEKFLG
ncbi:MAG: alpha/beta hydrolase [Anaerolineales bacterium]